MKTVFATLLSLAILAFASARMADPGVRSSPRACNPGFFLCDNGLCIPDMFVCDGVYDCTTGNDETSCASDKGSLECGEGFFMCANGLCIPDMFVCDGVYDCVTGTDETNCRAESVAERGGL